MLGDAFSFKNYLCLCLKISNWKTLLEEKGIGMKTGIDDISVVANTTPHLFSSIFDSLINGLFYFTRVGKHCCKGS